jgi:hypothetical protein
LRLFLNCVAAGSGSPNRAAVGVVCLCFTCDPYHRANKKSHEPEKVSTLAQFRLAILIFYKRKYQNSPLWKSCELFVESMPGTYTVFSCYQRRV